MIAVVRVLVVALVGIFAVTDAVFARTNAGAATDWGLLGTWRLDCSAPISRSDGELIYVVRDGKLFHDRNFGDAKDSNQVLSASITPEGGLEILLRFESLKETRQWTIVKGGDGRIRVVSNRNLDTDVYSIRDGKLTANDNPSVWMVRCR